MPIASTFEAFLLVYGSFLMLSFFSFLWFGSTYPFMLAEGTLIGGVIAQGLYATIQSARASAFDPLAAGEWLLIIPIIIGALAFARYTKYRWISRYTTSFQSGLGVGVATALTLKTEVVGIIQKTVMDLVESIQGGEYAINIRGGDVLSSIVTFIGVVSVFTFYLYSARFSTVFYEGPLSWLPKLGRAYMYMTLGFKVQLKQPIPETVIPLYRTYKELSLWLAGG
jgi:hypothetical protein